MIEARDLDFTGKASYVAVVNYILQAAGEDADKNGFGVRDLNRDDCSWALTRIAIEFSRKLEQYENIEIATWVNEVSRIMTTRNMEVTVRDGEPVAGVVSQWAIIDLAKRTAVDLREHIEYEGKLFDAPCPIAKPVRVAHVNAGETTEHKVVYSDIDFNCHMNSVKYLELMLDMLPLDYIENRLLHRMDINFLHEARYGEVLTVGFEEAGDRSLFEIKNGEELPLCKVALDWK